MPIGRGGMGEVFAARLRGESGFERWLAVKRIRPDLADDERATSMFFDEARTAACIHSPFVVPVLDVGRDADGTPFMVMELVLGPSVTELARRGPIPVEVTASILLDAARGLVDAHAATDPYGRPLHVVHRDVSPHNILVGVDGRARLTDFGLARAAHQRTTSGVGEVKGTFNYLAPEQALGSASQQSDLFSLGVVGWELLANRARIVAREPSAVLHEVVSSPVPRIATVAPDAPAALSSVIDRAVSHDRNRRHATAADFARQLASAIEADAIRVATPAEVGELATDVARERIAALRGVLARDGGLVSAPIQSEVTVPARSRLDDASTLRGLTLDTIPEDERLTRDRSAR